MHGHFFAEFSTGILHLVNVCVRVHVRASVCLGYTVAFLFSVLTVWISIGIRTRPAIVCPQLFLSAWLWR